MRPSGSASPFHGSEPEPITQITGRRVENEVIPDLLDIGERRERAWLSRYDAEPDRMLADGDAIANELFAHYRNVRMPNLGLSGDDVAALLAHIDAESRAVSERARKSRAFAR